MTEEQENVLALFGVPGVGTKTFALLTERFGSPDDVFEASETELLSLDSVGPVLVKNIRTYDRRAFIHKQKSLIDRYGVQLLIRSSENYPQLLNRFPSAPPVLFVRGKSEILIEQSLAFVGTRNPTGYGVSMTRQLVSGIVDAGMCVVSGMAAGIDAAAHKAALDRGGKTAAVFGCGVDVIYPRENRSLSDSILENGCFVSHFPMGTTPHRGNFPARNAVIVGLSLGTVVVEAPKKSGALITADLALRAGRKLFTVPANATSDTSEGSNMLLAKGAYPVLHTEHILQALGKPVPASVGKTLTGPPRIERPLPPGTGGNIVRKLGEGPLHIDDLSASLNMTVSETLNELTLLELEGYVRQKPGKIFEKI